MQLSVLSQDGQRLCLDVDIDPQSQYEIPLGERIYRAMLLLLPHAAPTEPKPIIVTDLVN